MTKIIAIAGSLGKNSINKQLLEAMIQVAPKTLEIEVLDISDIPLYDGDLEANYPSSATNLKKKIVSSDGVLIVTPEYNWSIPGVVKNFIDWASHPYGDNSWAKKPIAVAGATIGWQGTVRAQTELKSVLLGIGAYVMPDPEILFSHFGEKFDSEGNVKSEDDKQSFREFLEAFEEWTRHFK